MNTLKSFFENRNVHLTSNQKYKIQEATHQFMYPNGIERKRISELELTKFKKEIHSIIVPDTLLSPTQKFYLHKTASLLIRSSLTLASASIALLLLLATTAAVTFAILAFGMVFGILLALPIFGAGTFGFGSMLFVTVNIASKAIDALFELLGKGKEQFISAETKVRESRIQSYNIFDNIIDEVVKDKMVKTASNAEVAANSFFSDIKANNTSTMKPVATQYAAQGLSA